MDELLTSFFCLGKISEEEKKKCHFLPGGRTKIYHKKKGDKSSGKNFRCSF